MSFYDGLQVVQADGSQQRHYEAPILVGQYPHEAPIPVGQYPHEAPIPVGQHPHEAPIPALPNLYEKGPRIGVESGDGTPSGKSNLGMRRKTFWLVLAIMVVVIVAAIGGGVAGSLANKKTTPSGQPVTQSSGSATPSTASRTSATSSSSTPSASTPTSTTSGYTGCPDVNGTLFTADSGAKFMQYCAYDIASSTDINIDDQATQTLDECINLCDATNARNNNTGCKAVTYDFTSLDFLLCWLKNGTGTLHLDILDGTVGDYSVSAVLQ